MKPDENKWHGSVWETLKYYGNIKLLLFCHSVMSDSLRPHGLQHASLPCPSLSPGVCSNSCLLSRWCHPTISSFVAPFSSCPQSFLTSGSFKWISSLHQAAKVLEFQLQHQVILIFKSHQIEMGIFRSHSILGIWDLWNIWVFGIPERKTLRQLDCYPSTSLPKRVKKNGVKWHV